MSAERPTITSVRFSQYKALRDFSLSLERMNILVGPNNSGKSTIISAFRLLALAIQRANSRKPDLLESATGIRRGYRLSTENLPISLENVHTDYAETASSVVFSISDGGRLTLHFPHGTQECFMFADAASGRVISDTTAFKAAFPLRVGVVPVLGPVEHEEPIVEEDTVRRYIATHRASRHFRNYWRYFPDDWDEFRELLQKTWSGTDILEPERPDPLDQFLVMFSKEGQELRELYWAGFGFQIWCQILTHFVRNSEATIFVIDEPEIYLHADLQRQLLSMFREASTDVVIATHSAEIIGDAEPRELLLIDKQARSGRRAKSPAGVSQALRSVGSAQNVMLTQLVRTRRVLFVEGDDFQLIRRFARQAGFDRLATGADFAVVPLGGFPHPAAVKQLARGMVEAAGVQLLFAGVFDRDYRCEAELEEILAALARDLAVAQFYEGKEAENYLLDPEALRVATERALADRANRTGNIAMSAPDVGQPLDSISGDLKDDVISQSVSHRLKFTPPAIDVATTTSLAMREINDAWPSLDARLRLVPGKTVLRRLNERLQTEIGVHVTPSSIVSAMPKRQMPRSLLLLLGALDRFRERQVD